MTMDTGGSQGDVTRLLEVCRGGSPQARDELFKLVYADLKGIATRRLAKLGWRVVDPTELVHEASLRLLGSHIDAQSRLQFFGIAATAIRSTLVDIIRHQQAEKRGGNVAITLLDPEHESIPWIAPAGSQWLDIEEALSALERVYPRQCRVIELAYLVGLTQQEIAEALDVNLRTVERDLRFSKAWLRERLEA